MPVRGLRLELDRAVEAELRGKVDRTVAEISASAPVDDGDLAASVGGSVQVSNGRVDASISIQVPYASYVIFGTSRRPPNDAFVRIPIERNLGTYSRL